MELGDAVGEPVKRFQALWGRWLFVQAGRGDLVESRRTAEELIAIGERLGDPVLRLEAHHAMLPTTLWVGEPDTTRRHCEQGIALYDKEQHRSLAFAYGGHDPGVCCHMHSALALWLLGFPARALERSRAGLALAMDLGHAGSIVNAFPFATVVDQLAGDGAALVDHVGSMVVLATEHGLRQWQAWGRVFEAWIGAEHDPGSAAVEEFRRTIAQYRAMGNDLWIPCFQGLFAELCVKRGLTQEGLATIADALAMGKANGSQLWTPEYYRLRGELLRASDDAPAEAAFRQALDIARTQGTRAWELRAAVSLSRLWARRGQREDARRLLGEIHGWFTEGFDTEDLRAARHALDALT